MKFHRYSLTFLAMTCNEDDEPVDASMYSEEGYQFTMAIVGGFLCPLHPDWVTYGKNDFCNLPSCTSDTECTSGTTLDITMCWDLCMDCQGDSSVCQGYVAAGSVAPEGETDCVSSFDDIFQGSGMTLQFAPLLVILAIMLVL